MANAKKVTVDEARGVVIVELPIEEPRPSKSGKTNIISTVRVDGSAFGDKGKFRGKVVGGTMSLWVPRD